MWWAGHSYTVYQCMSCACQFHSGFKFKKNVLDPDAHQGTLSVLWGCCYLICLSHSKAQFSSVQSLSHVQLFGTPWIAARQASLCITNSRSLLKLMSIESVVPSSHLILCRPLLLLPPIPPSIRVFSSESTLCIRWSKYWSFSFNVSSLNEHPRLISRMDWLDLLAVQGTWKQPRCQSADEWIRKLWYIYTIEYYSAIKKNSFESVLMRWMKLEPIIQSEVSQKERPIQYTNTYIWNLKKDGNDNPICKAETETQTYITEFWTLWEKVRVGCSERIALK